ncbi:MULTISPECIES: MetQ/NlpA family ABC transporter substrate-binding protein [unclassified Kitasatospora]|uniref:MetQ/NlpA family ABC transporter substrate-binding protein n=1 Tax=unclassified Kitasatospora TaxID=2633591 RepID=UPI00070EEBBA|nr:MULTISPECIES: MetQ/NlpA family ABC transporter substrate-binding protein [unclassified Kitasatospora]KQV22845.1 metal ABC transporter substrate-binding protein [Kitasatospora sp. Root107]KRB61705.1 metal ABC transporter substrate-binding protein [Kitasatospora sp. Root187]
MRNVLKFTSVLATAGLALSLTACSSDSSSGSSPDAALKVIASPTPHAQILEYVQKNLADAAGLKLDVKVVTDYVTPNTAVQDGSADANYFQHVPYLEDFNKKQGTDIVSVETVHLEPLGLYSKKVKSVTELANGATVGLPNDTTNEGRALKLLADNGVIKLKDGVGTAATPADVVSNPKNLKWKELEAAQLPRSLPDLDAAVINGNYALEANLKPASDAILLEKAEGNPYANILAVKKGKENDPRVKKLAELLHSDKVKEYINTTFNGSVIPAF